MNTTKHKIYENETNLVENVLLNGYFGIDIGANCFFVVMCGWCSILKSFH